MIVCLDSNIVICGVERDPAWKAKVEARIKAILAAGDTLADAILLALFPLIDGGRLGRGGSNRGRQCCRSLSENGGWRQNERRSYSQGCKFHGWTPLFIQRWLGSYCQCLRTEETRRVRQCCGFSGIYIFAEVRDFIGDIGSRCPLGRGSSRFICGVPSRFITEYCADPRWLGIVLNRILTVCALLGRTMADTISELLFGRQFVDEDSICR